MALPVIEYREGQLKVLDQTRLPGEARMVELRDLEDVVEAIQSLRVRGAPLIGVSAAYGVCVALRGCEGLEAARAQAPRVVEALAASRPTAVNLFWALERMERCLAGLEPAGPGTESWSQQLEREARAIHGESEAQDAALAGHGRALLAAGARVITHCNTGPLATGGGGTALGVLIAAHGALSAPGNPGAPGKTGNPGKPRGLHVYVNETRPRWQGAHLTTWELANHGVPHTLMVDSAAAVLMRGGGIHSVWVGADRIAANGDTANKIGTYALALASRHHGVPFYVAAPTSTFDLTLDSGEGIPIEERDGAEVAAPGGLAIAPQGTAVWNPAFDVTPAALITAIVTERGIYHGPSYDLRAGPTPS